MATKETFQLAEQYSKKDIGELYQMASDTAKCVNDELEAIKIVGVKLGHLGLVDRVNEIETLRELEKVADDIDIRDFKTAVVCDDYQTVKEICYDNNIDFKEPSKKELELLLGFANLHGSTSIDYPNSSIGGIYQRLFGRDFDKFEFALVQKGKLVGSMKYSQIPNVKRDAINKQIIEAKLSQISEEDRKRTLAKLVREELKIAGEK